MRRILVGVLLAALLGVGAASPGTAAEPKLRLGSSGAKVVELQKALLTNGFSPGPIDGRFGPRTRRAVIAYQRANRLIVDGIVGPQTWGSLRKTTPAAPPTATTTTVASTPPGTPPLATWDRLAQCESGQRWNLNLGTGYYGGLQFTLAAWKGAGGTGYPHEATKEEQIARATVLWQKLGWNPWPGCTRKLGLG